MSMVASESPTERGPVLPRGRRTEFCGVGGADEQSPDEEMALRQHISAMARRFEDLGERQAEYVRVIKNLKVHPAGHRPASSPGDTPPLPWCPLLAPHFPHVLYSALHLFHHNRFLGCCFSKNWLCALFVAMGSWNVVSPKMGSAPLQSQSTPGMSFLLTLPLHALASHFVFTWALHL